MKNAKGIILICSGEDASIFTFEATSAPDSVDPCEKVENKIRSALPAVLRDFIRDCDGVPSDFGQPTKEDIQGIIDGDTFSPSHYAGKGFVKVFIWR